ncbi:MAG TPA: ABC transporter permease, partial [Acidobacteriota bacterium]|nr:ABC transporter permease [Acidobacteriota bacterium]
MTQRPTMIQRIRYYYNQRDLLLSYVRKDLKERYVGSVIGFYWSVLNPLILLGIYTFVFSVIFRVRFGEGEGLVNAALYIFCGMVPWMAFSEAVGRSTGVLIDNANLIKKVMFPSKILPMYLVFSHAVNLLIGFGILL